MKRLAALFPIALALGAMMLAPRAGAREPTKIKACQTISQPGSYELADNLAATADCLVITADFVTIDLAGFLISGGVGGNGILASPSGQRGGGRGIAVRNGSIDGFVNSVNLDSANGSIVEGLRVSSGRGVGIIARGIVRDNTATGFGGIFARAISATGTVTGNYASGTNGPGIVVGQGSTVIGNTATDNEIGLLVSCPSNLTDNTAVNNGTNLVLEGEGCHNEDNLAP
jgi:parallel beta-helix repeat protein